MLECGSVKMNDYGWLAVCHWTWILAMCVWDLLNGALQLFCHQRSDACSAQFDGFEALNFDELVDDEELLV